MNESKTRTIWSRSMITTRLLDHLRGLAIGTALTLASCGWLYLHTHEIKFSSVASNEQPAVVEAQAIEGLMSQASVPLPAKKPTVPRVQ